jgi:hypothetical protein
MKNLLAVSGLCLVMLCRTAGADVIPVADAAALATALDRVAPGDILVLGAGDFGALALRGLAGTVAAPITLRSADPAQPGRLSGLDLREVAHLRFEGLVFDYSFAPGDPPHLRPFAIQNATGILFDRNLFDGDRAQGVSPTDDGFPTAFGLSVRSCTDVVITQNEVRGFYRGLVIGGSDDLLVSGNDLHDIRMDGMNFAQVSGVVIAQNHIHDFARSLDSGDHADMIQFWTNGTEAPSTDIVIRDNILNAGRGWYTQSIFMRNDLVDRGLAGDEMFYRNITITGNVIINAHLHGISVGETDGLVIANNAVLRNRLAEGPDDNPGLWTPQIRVAEASRDVAITHNVTARVPEIAGQPDWNVRDNLIVQDRGRLGEGIFYDLVFVNALAGDPSDLTSFAPRPGGALDGTGIGPDLLRGGPPG